MRFLTIPGVIAAFSVAVIWAALQLELSPAMIVGDSAKMMLGIAVGEQVTVKW